MIKISEKQVKQAFPLILAVPYCDAQTLLKFKTPVWYTAGIYGKNADVFCEDDFIIATGYRPFGKAARFVKKYEEKAVQFMAKNKNASYKIQKKGLQKIVFDWLQKEFAEK